MPGNPPTRHREAVPNSRRIDNEGPTWPEATA